MNLISPMRRSRADRIAEAVGALIAQFCLLLPLGGLGWRSLARARRDADRILAVCDAVERLRAERQGGESR